MRLPCLVPPEFALNVRVKICVLVKICGERDGWMGGWMGVGGEGGR
jgi:hypothetical protein